MTNIDNRKIKILALAMTEELIRPNSNLISSTSERDSRLKLLSTLKS